MRDVKRIAFWSFIVSTVLGGSAARATTVTSASCTLAGITQTSAGPTSSACVSELHYVDASAQATEFLAPLHAGIQESRFAQITVQAGSEAVWDGTFPQSTQFSVQGSASDVLELLSAGPARPGFIQFDFNISTFHNGQAGVVITDGVHQYAFQYYGADCQLRPCVYAATAPFNLGSVFDFSANANSSANGSFAFDNFGGGSGYMMTTFSLFESDGTPVAFSPVPEPRDFGLVALGLVAIGCSARRPFRPKTKSA